mmetsp:Transcript_4068/g.4486  ORF Transcript_4068/g.4486 Transcript_4068/m.4486 type:complete len:210 (-) Transcript_4068:60-689(-)
MNQAKGCFGFTDSKNIGQCAFPAIQAAPSFSSSFAHIFGKHSNLRCLIPCAIDQDPYFRMTRDVAPRLGWVKPALIHSKFFPALQGNGTKMSASVADTAIYLTDSPKEIARKINEKAFSGGQVSAAEQRKLGANLEVDIPYQYLTFFMEDDEKLLKIKEDYSTGKLLTGEVKKILIDIIIEKTKQHQKARAAVTEDIVDAFMAVRKLSW